MSALALKREYITDRREIGDKRREKNRRNFAIKQMFCIFFGHNNYRNGGVRHCMPQHTRKFPLIHFIAISIEWLFITVELGSDFCCCDDLESGNGIRVRSWNGFKLFVSMTRAEVPKIPGNFSINFLVQNKIF